MILIDTCSSISLLDKQLHHLLSFVQSLQPIQFSVSGADSRPLIVLNLTSLPFAIDDNASEVQIVVARNILFCVILGINFLQRHGVFIMFPTHQLYLSNSSLKTVDQPIKPNRIYNTYISPVHVPNPYHPLSCVTISPIPIILLILNQ